MIRTVLAGTFIVLLIMSAVGVANVSVGDATVDLPSISINDRD